MNRRKSMGWLPVVRLERLRCRGETEEVGGSDGGWGDALARSTYVRCNYGVRGCDGSIILSPNHRVIDQDHRKSPSGSAAQIHRASYPLGKEDKKGNEPGGWKNEVKVKMWLVAGAVAEVADE